MESWELALAEKKVKQIFKSRQSRDRTGNLLVGKQRSNNHANHARPSLFRAKAYFNDTKNLG